MKFKDWIQLLSTIAVLISLLCGAALWFADERYLKKIEYLQDQIDDLENGLEINHLDLTGR